MSTKKFIFPPHCTPTSSNSSSSSLSVESCCDGKGKRKRDGKGSNVLFLVRKLCYNEVPRKLKPREITSFLAVFVSLPHNSSTSFQIAWNYSRVHVYTNHHFLWSDIQLSKGHLNKDRVIEVELIDKSGVAQSEKMFYRSAPFLGVKQCPHQGCTYVALMRNCPTHPKCKLARSDNCPVEFVYMFPHEYQEDHRPRSDRWHCTSRKAD